MTPQPSHEERLHTNYNEVGVAVLQAMYSEDYLSLGGIESTAELARIASVDKQSELLDIGCGLGGPMLHLAGTIGCRVTGIDLVQSNIDQAQRRTSDRGLTEIASFHQGDATSLPFEDDAFDIVWGQDAWCHVPDKAALLAEAARVLRPGGTIAFTDWLADNGMPEPERSAALDAALCSTAVSADEYVSLLGGAGFVAIEHTDIGPIFCQRYQEICADLETNRADLTDRFGARVYEIVAELNATIRRGFEGSAIGGGRYLARRS